MRGWLRCSVNLSCGPAVQRASDTGSAFEEKCDGDTANRTPCRALAAGRAFLYRMLNAGNGHMN
eukprot:3493176-Amphidinium_carterae.3